MFDVVWHDVAWRGVVWCGMMWRGVVWCGVVWCGMVWRGVAWSGVARVRAGCLKLWQAWPHAWGRGAAGVYTGVAFRASLAGRGPEPPSLHPRIDGSLGYPSHVVHGGAHHREVRSVH